MMRASALGRRLEDVRDAVLSVPRRDAWRRCAWVFLIFVACAAPIGLASGLLHPSRPPLGAGRAIAAALMFGVHPAFTEEIVFRALLLPRRPDATRRATLAVVIVGALLLYVVAHPLNARMFWPSAWSTFSNPFYLALAALLGVACTAAYLISGSIWPPVLMHWITVTVWMLFLGGRTLLQSAS